MPVSTNGAPNTAGEAKRLRELELENGKLKRLLAEAHLDMHALKSVFGTKR
jgi:putative transposase